MRANGRTYKVLYMGMDIQYQNPVVIFQDADSPSLVYTAPLYKFLEMVDNEKYPGCSQKFLVERKQ